MPIDPGVSPGAEPTFRPAEAAAPDYARLPGPYYSPPAPVDADESNGPSLEARFRAAGRLPGNGAGDGDDVGVSDLAERFRGRLPVSRAAARRDDSPGGAMGDVAANIGSDGIFRPPRDGSSARG